ncbi:MAG: hypothetical protein Q9187_002989 [Circinaria calcarea]
MFPKGMPDLRRGDDLLSRSLTPRSLHFLKGWIASQDPIHFPTPPIISPWHGFCVFWRTTILDYTSRSLTFEKERLAAIACLASVIQCKTKLQYIAGMRNVKSTIEYELCWKREEQVNSRPSFPPKEYRAPTWSWASVEGRISYDYERDYDVLGDTHLAFVEDAEIETIDGTPTGLVKSGLIRINVPLTEEPDVGFDPDDQIDQRLETFYMTISELYRNKTVWDLALRRLKSGSNQCCYERIGSFGFSGENIYKTFYSALKQLITII